MLKILGSLLAGVALLVTASSVSALTTAAPTDDYGTPDTAHIVVCPALTQTLRRAMRDADTTPAGQVTRLQQFLADHFDLDEDTIMSGYFGRNTQKYVILFQLEQGFPADASVGIVGSMTRATIAKVCGAPTSSASATTTLPVGYVQPSYVATSTPAPYAQGSYATSTVSGVLRNPAAKIDRGSLATTTNIYPTITGTASNIGTVGLFIETWPGSAEGVTFNEDVTAPVVNWRFSLTPRGAMTTGKWVVLVGDPKTNAILDSGSIVINHEISGGTYRLTAGGVVVSEVANLSPQVAQANCQGYVTSHPSAVVVCTFDGNQIYPTVSATSLPADVTAPGLYRGYFDGALFIETQNISLTSARANCEMNAASNPYRAVRCIFNGVEFYSRAPLLTPATPPPPPPAQPATTTATTSVATADLKINGSDGPVTLAEGQPISVSWTSTGESKCQINGVWSAIGAQYAYVLDLAASGSGQYFAYVPTYAGFSIRLTCSGGASGSAYDTVSVTPGTTAALSTGSAANLASVLEALSAIVKEIIAQTSH